MDFLAVSTTSCYFMEENFSISLFFPEKKKEEKEKSRKTITTALPPKKNYQIIFAWLLKDSKSQNKKQN